MKKIAVVLVLLTSFLLTAMSDDGKNEPNVEKKEVKSSETVKDQFGIDTEMSKEEYEQFKKDYFDYQKSKRIRGERAYNTKINFLEIGKLKKYGIDLDKSLDMCNINDFIVRSELIIIGTYESVEVDKDMKLTYPVTFKVKVNEVIANGTEHSTIPEIITLKGFNWDIPYEKLYKMKKDFVKKGGQYVMFLSRYDFHYFKKAYEDGSRKTIVTDNCFNPYTFSVLGFSLREIKNNKIAKDYSQSDLDIDYWLDLKELKKNAEEIFEINDKDNFYKRSYK